MNAHELTLAAPAKINLFLHIVGRRDDGYHLLESAFELIDWSDLIMISPRADSQIERCGDTLGPAHLDLAVRAAQALQRTPQWQAAGRPGATIQITKNIPAGAGLGGGSSDAASTLMGLNHLWGLEIGDQQLSELGLQLGADVPFFLFGKSAFAQGVGERLEAYEGAPRWLAIAVPPCHVKTAEIFSAPELTRNSKPSKIAGFAQAARQPVWEFGHNDLQAVTASRFPQVRQALQWLKTAAASEGIAPAAVRMSGSGGAVFCTAPDAQTAQRLVDRVSALQNASVDQSPLRLKVCQTLMRHPGSVL
ncbi:MAG: 4-(cytidine 5'-diphospho)-2-C-methyl-D-erythritol kinase [Betaproteobacteria bacterium]|jgi:4-diphosphocytidyl-2-C-methyl-D-erythritol kinase|nr:4-(cytidine 5'-diphospho)-2-C-methyl-D-erythritol kinase [Betaproteobacteria bacterium]